MRTNNFWRNIFQKISKFDKLEREVELIVYKSKHNYLNNFATNEQFLIRTKIKLVM